MARKQFYFSRSPNINFRQDTRDKGRNQSENIIGKNFTTGPIFIKILMFNFDGISRNRTKNAFHQLQNMVTTCFENRIKRSLSLDSKSITFAILCNTVFAILVHVNCVKISSKNVTWKVNFGPNKHYTGIKSDSAASVSFSGETLACVFT